MACVNTINNAQLVKNFGIVAQQKIHVVLCSQRMKDEIMLSPDQLEMVFDTLDKKKNGYLTLDQFLKGFSRFDNKYTRSRPTLRRSGAADLTAEVFICRRISDYYVIGW